MFPLWPIPLLAGVLPLLATLVAFQLSLHLELVPACNPFVDGCVSISRAARHDLPNIVFRALVLPAAVLHALTWMLCPAWLRGAGGGRERRVGWVPGLGVAAAAFLVLYGTFLGTEGEGYRWMRRYGVVFFFGLTCIVMLLVAGAMQHAARAQPRGARVARALVVVCAGLPLLGLAHVLLPLALPAEAHDGLENVTEWWAGLVITLYFGVLAWGWRTTGFAARTDAPR